MADKKTRRGRALLIVLLGIGLLAAVGSLSAAWVARDEPAATVTASPTAGVTTAAPTPMTSEEARAEFYRQHPRATGWWQWVLIGGLLVALAVIAGLLFTRPKPEK
ncbi:hypothetical protein [Cryptosporangium sp. NPDC048952]|uniref:hypothetical protein n=1 Tax=Cryptosporangium sp. NPDC048952 TaxID=3363961 RepID=UPI0037142EFF